MVGKEALKSYYNEEDSDRITKSCGNPTPKGVGWIAHKQYNIKYKTQCALTVGVSGRTVDSLLQ